MKITTGIKMEKAKAGRCTFTLEHDKKRRVVRVKAEGACDKAQVRRMKDAVRNRGVFFPRVEE